MEQVIRVLESTVNGTQQQIDEATGMLRRAKEANFGQLMLTMAVVLSTESASSISRRQAALYIKNNLGGTSQQVRDKNAQEWEKVDPKTREEIKGHVLNTLITKDKQVARQAAQALSALALLELPRGRWPDLMKNLCGACDPKNSDDLKGAALVAINYICQDIEETYICEHLGIILTAVVNNMMGKNSSNEIVIAASEALENMVTFLKPVFQNKTQRDVLMQVVFQNCTAGNLDIKTINFRVLSGILVEYYASMAEYMNVVFQLTLPIIQGCKNTEDDDELELVMQAINVWINIAEVEADKAYAEEDAAKYGTVIEEMDKSRKYTEGAMGTLLPALLVPLAKQDEDSEDDEWNVSHAAATCISYIAECVRDKILPVVLPLMNNLNLFMLTQNADSDKWRELDAALILFGSILEGPSTDALRPYLSDDRLLKLFIDNMKHPNPIVRDSAAWTLGRMCQMHVDLVVTTQQRFEAVYQAFKQGIEDSNSSAATMCTWGILVLAESLDEYINRSSSKVPNPISAHFTDLVKALFASGEKRDCPPKQRKGTYQAIGALVKCSTPDCIAQVAQVTVMCLERIMTMTSVQSPPDKKDAEELEGLVGGLLSECVNKLEEKIGDIADRVCAAYLALYQKGHGASATEEAVLGLASFASALGPAVERYASPISAVLKECIGKPEEVDMCKDAIGAIGDLARALDTKFGQYVSMFVPVLLTLLSPEHNRCLFEHVFAALGDIAQSAIKEFASYIPQTISLAQQAVSSKVNLSDEDEKDFLFDLQESCFTCIAGIQAGLSTLNMSGQILPYSGSIAQCISVAYKNTMRPESLSRSIVGAICDLVIAAGPRVKEAIAPGMPWADFPQMVKTIEENAEDPMTKENCKYAMERMVRVVQA